MQTIKIEPPTYKMQISGTRVSQIAEITLMLPKIITEAAKVIAIAKTHIGISGNNVANELLMAEVCTALPIPKDASIVKIAKAPAPNFVAQCVLITSFLFLLKARRKIYIAPPSISPLESLTRYLIARYVSVYFVAMPKIPVSHIQKTAPGPPAAMAVPTPIIFPVPKVAERTVHSAPN